MAYQDTKRQQKEAVRRLLAKQNELKAYNQNARSISRNALKQANDFRSSIGNWGNTLSNSNNPKIANLGSNLYKYTGQQGLNALKGNMGNAIKQGVTNLGSKLGIGGAGTAGTSALGAETGALGAGAAETAGSLAGAGTSGTAGALGAGTAASGAGAGAAAAGASAIPIAGQIAAAAILAASALKSQGDKNRSAAMQESMGKLQEAQNQAANKKIEAMQNIQPAQNTNFTINGSEDDAMANDIMSSVTQNNGNFTGGAAPIDFQNIQNQRQQLQNEDKAAFSNLAGNIGNGISNFAGSVSNYVKNIPNYIENEVFDPTSDMKGSVLYDYRSPKTLNRIREKELKRIQADTPQNITIDSPAGQKILQDNQAASEQQIIDKLKEQYYKKNPQTSVNFMPPPAEYRNTPQFITVNDPKADNNLPNVPAVYSGVSAPSPQGGGGNTAQIQGGIQQMTEPHTGRFDDFTAGFRDNYYNSFSPANLKRADKSSWNRAGEVLGSLARFSTNPLLHAGLAAYLTKKFGGSNGQAAKNAFDYGSRRQLANLYSKVLRDNGIETPYGFFGAMGSNDVNSILKPQNDALDRRYKDADLQIKLEDLGIKKQNADTHRIMAEKYGQKQTALKPEEQENWGNDLAEFYTRYTNPKYAKKRAELQSEFIRKYKVDPLKYLKLDNSGYDAPFDDEWE